MTALTQQQLDAALDRTHTIQVEISPRGPLPTHNTAYNSLRNLNQTGFSFTPRELIQAIGCKTAALPQSPRDECLKNAWLYTSILDLYGQHLSFNGGYGSDLQTNRSNEIGIGMMCLLAERFFRIPWDQLGPLPAPGKRFDYRGTNGPLDCIFEAKGTSHRVNQSDQIDSGLQKKTAHHNRNQYFDVELIISTCVERNGNSPKIILADPEKSSFKELYDKGGDRYFRLKHYCRVLQYIGLPRSAYHLNRFALDYLHNRKSIYKTIFEEKAERGYLESVTIEGDVFLGRWFSDWLPEESKRYKHLYKRKPEFKLTQSDLRRSVFQGVRRDVYDAGLAPDPFSHDLIEERTLGKYRYYNSHRVSVFSDGTVMLFDQG